MKRLSVILVLIFASFFTTCTQKNAHNSIEAAVTQNESENADIALIGSCALSVKSAQNENDKCIITFYNGDITVLYTESSLSVVSIEKRGSAADSEGTSHFYYAKTSDGEGFEFSKRFKKENESVSVIDISLSEDSLHILKSNGESTVLNLQGEDSRDMYRYALEIGYSGSYTEFLSDIFKNEAADLGNPSPSLLSTVSVFAGSPYTTTAGAGVIYSLDQSTGTAYIITNCHVLFSKSDMRIYDNIYISLYGMTENNSAHPSTYGIKAEYIGGCMEYDIAVLKITSPILSKSCYKAVLLSSVPYYTGDEIFAVGNPDGEGLSITSGIISKALEYINITSADMQNEFSARVIRFDAPTGRGNSGGGLYSKSGELIGLVNAKKTGEFEGVSYAIPVNIVQAVAESIIEKGDFYKLSLGISLYAQEPICKLENGRIITEEKILIKSVSYGSISSGRLYSGDILLSASVGTQKHIISSINTIPDILLLLKPSDTLVITLLRDGKILEIPFYISENFFIKVK